jgi:hypothetical protein
MDAGQRPLQVSYTHHSSSFPFEKVTVLQFAETALLKLGHAMRFAQATI